MSAEKFGMPSEAGRIEDVDKAWTGALAEKPVRDLAREEGVSEEEKAILDRLAMRRGEKALQEYGAEKEKNPCARLVSAIEKTAASMKEKGLDKDAEIMSKIQARLNRYLAFLGSEIKIYEKENNKRVTYEDSPDSILNSMYVTDRVGKDGEGYLLFPGGQRRGSLGEPELYAADKALSKMEQIKDKEGETEFMNYGFTDKGSTEFLRALGVLGQAEEYIDLPQILEKAGKKNVDPQNFQGTFQTMIDGLHVKVYRTPESRGSKGEEAMKLLFKKTFMEQLIADQKK